MAGYTLRTSIYDLTFGSALLTGYDDCNPLNLPAYTLRLQYAAGVTPSITSTSMTQVSSSPNVWDVTYMNRDWSNLLSGDSNLLSVLGGNCTDVTKMSNLFKNCTSLTSVPRFDTANVTLMDGMLQNCSQLTQVPLFYTDRATNTSNMLSGCVNVSGGSLALYQQASGQATPPANHSDMFTNCGSNTVTGLDELSQIPITWGGTQPIRATLRFEVPNNSGILQLCNMGGCNIVSGVRVDRYGTTTALTSEELQRLQNSPESRAYEQYLQVLDYVELVVEPTQAAITWSTATGWSPYADIEVTITNTDTSAVSSMQYTQQVNLNVSIQVP